MEINLTAGATQSSLSISPQKEQSAELVSHHKVRYNCPVTPFATLYKRFTIYWKVCKCMKFKHLG